MKWCQLNADGETGLNEGFQCSGCGAIIRDLIFYPQDWDTAEAKHLEAAMAVPIGEGLDPHTLGFCGDCKYGVEEVVKGSKK